MAIVTTTPVWTEAEKVEALDKLKERYHPSIANGSMDKFVAQDLIELYDKTHEIQQKDHKNQRKDRKIQQMEEGGDSWQSILRQLRDEKEEEERTKRDGKPCQAASGPRSASISRDRSARRTRKPIAAVSNMDEIIDFVQVRAFDHKTLYNHPKIELSDCRTSLALNLRGVLPELGSV